MKEQGITQGLPWDSVSTHESAPAPALKAEVRPAYTYGLKPVERQQMPGNNATVMTLLLGTLLLVALNFRQCSAALAALLEDCWNVRRRGSLFDIHATGENRTAFVLFILTAVTEGILLATHLDVASTANAIMPCTAAAAAYLTLQLAAYWTLGYTFTDPEGRQLYMRGFVATQSLLGLGLVIPATIAMFVPVAGGALVAIGLFLYIVARLTFIVKGFRLFYDGFYSLSYFILYLCTLEVAPIWVMVRLAQS